MLTVGSVTIAIRAAAMRSSVASACSFRLHGEAAAVAAHHAAFVAVRDRGAGDGRSVFASGSPLSSTCRSISRSCRLASVNSRSSITARSAAGMWSLLTEERVTPPIRPQASATSAASLSPYSSISRSIDTGKRAAPRRDQPRQKRSPSRRPTRAHSCQGRIDVRADGTDAVRVGAAQAKVHAPHDVRMAAQRTIRSGSDTRTDEGAIRIGRPLDRVRLIEVRVKIDKRRPKLPAGQPDHGAITGWRKTAWGDIGDRATRDGDIDARESIGIRPDPLGARKHDGTRASAMTKRSARGHCRSAKDVMASGLLLRRTSGTEAADDRKTPVFHRRLANPLPDIARIARLEFAGGKVNGRHVAMQHGSHVALHPVKLPHLAAVSALLPWQFDRSLSRHQSAREHRATGDNR